MIFPRCGISKQYYTETNFLMPFNNTCMNKRFIIYSIISLLSFNGFSQDEPANNTGQTMQRRDVYKLKAAVDIPLTAAGIAWSLYAFPKIYDKENSTIAQIQSLNVNNINGFDRWAAAKYSEKADATSDIFFYASIPMPLLLLADKDIRKDAAKIGFLYLETLSVTGIFYTATPYMVDRYRPFAYNTSVPMDQRVSGNARNSFLAGHPALVGTTTFFMAKIYSDYHPESNFKYVLFGVAIAATGTTAYLRHRAGRHFPSDLLTGMTVGTLSGILVPHFHKNKDFKKQHLSILPYSGQSHGIVANYRF
jgi:membrane-associated phospholipid phosphatase